MRKVVLFCAGGMSTSLLVTKMQKAAESMDYACEISAHSVASVEKHGKNADIILLGPQVRYKLEQVKKVLPNIPVEVVAMTDYGMMNGTKVMAHVKEVLQD